jgi:CTP-dependent riboflavin kinase
MRPTKEEREEHFREKKEAIAQRKLKFLKERLEHFEEKRLKKKLKSMKTISKNRDIEKYYVKQTPIEFINDNSISSNAFRLMMQIMSDSDIFKIYLTNLANRMDISYRTAQRYMKELEDADYVYKKRVNGVWNYHIFFKKLVPDRIVIGGDK